MIVVRDVEITDQANDTSILRALVSRIDGELDSIEVQMRMASLSEAADLERHARSLIQEIGLLSTEIRKREPSFYASRAWKELRYRVLVKSGQRCQCCGASAARGAALHVDHIKPRSLYPELALDESNLQVLCCDCNTGKSNRDDTDFRPTLTAAQLAHARELIDRDDRPMKEVADLLGVHRTTLWRALQKTDRLPNRKIVNTEQTTS